MKHLEKITISNIRRFGENVEINIGKGATIFLAPNGTGKTAIFEAIELALTGKVKRLLYPPEPLIRDLQLEASIKLDFEDGKYCQAIFKKGTEPVLEGFHKELFGKVDDQDLPFLLQLTHFLNQQGNNWFVNSHGPDAGSQLDHLSIGREATEINQLIPSAKRAAGNELSSAQKDFDETQERWKQWLSLIDKRKQTNVGLINELQERDLLLRQMNAIAVQFKDFPIEKEAKLFTLKVLNAELLSVCKSGIDSLKQRSIELRSMYSLVPEFVGLSQNLIKAKEKLTAQQQFLRTNESEFLALTKAQSELANSVSEKQASLISMQDSRRQFNQQQVLNAQLASFNAKINALDLEIKRVTTEEKSATIDLDNALKNISHHQVLQKRTESINTEQRRVEQLKSALQNWESINTSLITLTEKTLPNLKEEIKDLVELKASSIRLETKAKEDLEKSQIGFDALNQTVDVIKTAVGTIIAEYPKERGDCPVCGTDFQPHELQLKMTETARIIHPGLKALASLIESSRAHLRDATERLKAVEVNIAMKNGELLNLESDVKKLSDQITTTRDIYFNSCETIADAEVTIKKLIQANSDALLTLNQDKKNSLPLVSEEQRIDLNERVKTLNDILKKNIAEFNKIKVEADSVSSTLQSLNLRIDPNINIDQLSENVKIADDELLGLKNRINEIKGKIDSQTAAINSVKDEIIREEINISQLTTRISEYRTRWIDAKLIGDPNIDALKPAIENLETRMSNGEKYIDELEQINRELTKWQVVEDDLKVEDEIKIWRGQIEENTFHKHLEGLVSEKKEKLKVVSQNMEILSVFSECLSRELDVVHERIVSINPLWKKLLKRIIIDPRFANTQLDSFSYYKKQHANVNVQLHGGDVLVSQVASEAQITDLQLTFMLAMAQKYQWTTWKSLLLDDPTQHHDLVHASAVFDLLRDYIADFDFQILMATHDPVQAKFFMRKLENDGIPVNICTLFATEDGVEAKIGA